MFWPFDSSLARKLSGMIRLPDNADRLLKCLFYDRRRQDLALTSSSDLQSIEIRKTFKAAVPCAATKGWYGTLGVSLPLWIFKWKVDRIINLLLFYRISYDLSELHFRRFNVEGKKSLEHWNFGTSTAQNVSSRGRISCESLKTPTCPESLAIEFTSWTLVEWLIARNWPIARVTPQILKSFLIEFHCFKIFIFCK